jgi:hypothetical protein
MRFAASPIISSEVRHVERGQRIHRRLSNLLNRALWYALLLTSLSMTLFCVLLAAVDLSQYDHQPGERYLNITYILGVLLGITFYIHFRVQVETLGMAADAIAREKRGNTWESLLLTGIGARPLIIGKWWAVVRLMWRDYIRLGLLRIGCTIGIGALLLTEPRIGFFQLSEQPDSWAALRMLLAAVLVMAVTMVNLLFTAAAGVLGGFFSRPNAPGSSTATVVRMTVVLIPVLLMLLPVAAVILNTQFRLTSSGTELLSLMGLFQVFLIDNGTFILAELANPLAPWMFGYITVTLASIMAYIGLTAVSLKLAQRVAQQQGAN